VTDGELLQLIRDETRQAEGRVEIDCEKALALASRVGRPPRDIGKLCNAHGIRIVACQLGCFP